MSVPALVLAAGLGTRLDPLTRLVAKPAVPLGDRTLIEHVLGWITRQGIRHVVVNLHHRPQTIAAVVGDGAHLGLRVRYSWEQPLLGSAGGPRRALPLLDSDVFLVVNGDTLADFDVRPMIRAHEASGADVTLAVVPNRSPDRYNGLTVDAEWTVTGFVPRGQATESWHFVGVQVARARVFEPLEDGVPAESVAELYREMVRRAPGRIRAFRADTAFVDVGTPGDYLDACRANADGRRQDVVRCRSCIWPGASVEPGARIEDCIVAGPVVVPAGFQARSAILAPPDIVRPTDRVDVRGGVAVFAIARPGSERG
jgi:mannose-1-phosphate guanylyltransferase